MAKAEVEFVEIVKGVRAMGLETCMTLGMLTPKQADMLKEAGLDYYNHNVDTGPEYYERVISTRNYQDRLDTLQNVRKRCAAEKQSKQRMVDAANQHSGAERTRMLLHRPFSIRT